MGLGSGTVPGYVPRVLGEIGPAVFFFLPHASSVSQVDEDENLKSLVKSSHSVTTCIVSTRPSSPATAMSHMDHENDSEVSAVLRHARTAGATGTFHPTIPASLVQPNIVSLVDCYW